MSVLGCWCTCKCETVVAVCISLLLQSFTYMCWVVVALCMGLLFVRKRCICRVVCLELLFNVAVSVRLYGLLLLRYTCMCGDFVRNMWD